ncbi:MAG: MarR family transcriptional regulator [Candidatus Hodarchaeota archaeon]
MTKCCSFHKTYKDELSYKSCEVYYTSHGDEVAMVVGAPTVRKEEIISGPIALRGMSRSIQTIYGTLAQNGRMKPQELSQKTELSARTVRYALQRLRAKELVKRVPDLTDLRSHYYQINIR